MYSLFFKIIQLNCFCYSSKCFMNQLECHRCLGSTHNKFGFYWITFNSTSMRNYLFYLFILIYYLFIYLFFFLNMLKDPGFPHVSLSNPTRGRGYQRRILQISSAFNFWNPSRFTVHRLPKGRTSNCNGFTWKKTTKRLSLKCNPLVSLSIIQYWYQVMLLFRKYLIP